MTRWLNSKFQTNGWSVGGYMPIKNKILIMINIFWVFSAQASESNVDPVLANLWVNELDMNTDVTLIKQNNQFYIECSI